MIVHHFHDPLSMRTVELVVGDDRESTGVKHAGIQWHERGRREPATGCDGLADVSPELDCAFCTRCHWQCRISGAWFMDVLAEARGVPDADDEPSCECCDSEGNHRHDPLCEHPCCPDGDLDDEPERTCRGCGCTDDDACGLGCWWVADDLCSACDGLPATTPKETQ